LARSTETFSKKEKEKARLKKSKDKKEKAEERKANAGKGKTLEDMMAYIDEHGNIVRRGARRVRLPIYHSVHAGSHFFWR